MAITAQVPTILPAGAPALGQAGQIVWGPGDVQEPAFVGYAIFTGDGSTTSANVNWIDGTKTIPFTPSAVLAFGLAATGSANSGNDTAGVLYVEGSAVHPRVSGITNAICTLNFSTAIANTSTFGVLLVVYK